MRVYQFRHIRAERQCSPARRRIVAARTMAHLARVFVFFAAVLALLATTGATDVAGGFEAWAAAGLPVEPAR